LKTEIVQAPIMCDSSKKGSNTRCLDIDHKFYMRFFKHVLCNVSTHSIICSSVFKVYFLFMYILKIWMYVFLFQIYRQQMLAWYLAAHIATMVMEFQLLLRYCVFYSFRFAKGVRCYFSA